MLNMSLKWMIAACGVALVATACDTQAPAPSEEPTAALTGAGGKSDGVARPMFQCNLTEDDFLASHDALRCEDGDVGIFLGVFLDVWSGDNLVASGDLMDEALTDSFEVEEYPLEVRYQAVADADVVGNSFILKGRFIIEDRESWALAQGPALPFELWTLEVRSGDADLFVDVDAYDIAAGDGHTFGNDDATTARINDISRLVGAEQTVTMTFVAPASGSLAVTFEDTSTGELTSATLNGSSVIALGDGGGIVEPVDPGEEDPVDPADPTDPSDDGGDIEVDACAERCGESEVCVAGDCVERREQVQENINGFECAEAEAVCDAGEDEDCAEGHACVEGLCRRISCQTQESVNGFECAEAEAVCEVDAHCAEGHTCAQGLCRRNRCQTQEQSNGFECAEAEAVCDAGEDEDCAEGHACVEGLCRRIRCQTQESINGFECAEAEAVCEVDAHCAERHTCLEGLCHRDSCM